MKLENNSLKIQLNKKDEQITQLKNFRKIFGEMMNNNNISNSDIFDNHLKMHLFNLIKDNSINLNNNNYNKNILKECFGNNLHFTQFLINRINYLENQNNFLVHKVHNLSLLASNAFDELVEYIDIIDDIKQVTNIIYDSQALVDEFYIIRNTLNQKEDYLAKQREHSLKEKEKLFVENKEFTKTFFELNENIHLLQQEIINEKQKYLFSIQNNLLNYENYLNKITNKEDEEQIDSNLLNNTIPIENILKVNYALKEKFNKLHDVLIYFLKLNENKEIDETIYFKITEILNKKEDFLKNDDLFFFLKNSLTLIDSKLN